MSDNDPFRAQPADVVKSDRRVQQEADAEAARGEVPAKAAEVKAWIEEAPDRDERIRRAGLAADVEGQRSEPRVTVLDAAEAAYAEDEPDEDDDEG